MGPWRKAAEGPTITGGERGRAGLGKTTIRLACFEALFHTADIRASIFAAARP